MIFSAPLPAADELRQAVRDLTRADETRAVEQLLDDAVLSPSQNRRIAERARDLVIKVRARKNFGIDAFLHEYQLSTHEGVVLMCLAEALLRIPDSETADRLIRDKLGTADWDRHVGRSESLFVNASTWGLMLTGRLLKWEKSRGEDVGSVLGRMIARGGEPVVRQAMMQAMRIMGRQFVMGRTIEEALKRAGEHKRERHSFDMLGEAARTEQDAQRYLTSYGAAIAAIGKAAKGRGPIEAPGISVKLSALHPRYEFAQRERTLNELLPRIVSLAEQAKVANIGVTIDAEEADRLDLSLDIIDALSREPRLKGWNGLGLAVQAYQKRAPAVIDWLAALARRDGRRWMVRLVKGAYWDTEIKRGQERGLDGYPVFTRKQSTDLCYLACAKRIAAAPAELYPQFATHNALTLASVVELMDTRTDYEFQRLHGMGEALYEEILAANQHIACRVYAPVGSHEDLLPYLVRRLLENGANTSFVNRIVDEDLPVEQLIAGPAEQLASFETIRHPRIPLPRDMFGGERPNSSGLDLSDPNQLLPLQRAMEAAAAPASSAPIVNGRARPQAAARAVTNPADRRQIVGTAVDADAADIEAALASAHRAANGWNELGAAARADILERAGASIEAHRPGLMALLVREAGKSIPDALSEVREAVDFCRYYGAQARRRFGAESVLPGPTGEANRLTLHGRGVFAAISPWNFPLAIFTGQVAAGLAAGNAVIAKPAEQTPLTAAACIRLLHEAGVPGAVLHLLPGPGETVGAQLIADERIAGVVFTGGTDTAQAINRGLAARRGPIVPLIAETGGQNALIADSSALTEQVVADALLSAFNSAGQRCSALRVLFIQDDVADKTLSMLAGAMAELRIGDPALLATDVGPVIDDEARVNLLAHIERMKREAKLIHACGLPAEAAHGTFVAPHAFEIDKVARLEREVFGPVLHVVRFDGSRIDRVIEAVNATGYGLTLGIHSRIDETIETIRRGVRAGNCYVNRNMIGAVVGVQPFGGEGLSGTGPKAGGPHYLPRFAVERTLSVNTTASGGNAALMTLDDR
ncbi:MAG: bifunctional proline dehydrogenase/L-glutamate gamma-semialdehyde dehydrogenase PutA [Alphaproteobacteria bacterium]